MDVPENLFYSLDHQWVLVESDERIRIGITDYAQDALGGIVFVDLPELGSSLRVGEALGEVESSKSVSEIVIPVTGEVMEINDELESDPMKINEDPYGEGWICVVAPEKSNFRETLLNAVAYKLLIDG